jgi:AraC-like DNA-binding protein
LVKEVRLEKAKVALKSAQTDVQQLALDLGFSDRRGFERAFKQWTGLTPAAYRRQHLTKGCSLIEESK